MSEWPTISRRAFVGVSGLTVAGGFSNTIAADTEERVRWLDSGVYANASSATVVGDIMYIGTRESGLFAYETSGQKHWAFAETGDFFYVAPTVVDGVCYAKDTAGSLFALEADSGELLWSIEEEFPGSSSPTVYKDRCYVCGEERLAAVDTFSGDIEWTSDEILGPVGTGVTITEERCYVSGEGGVTAHDVQTGEQMWAFPQAGYAENWSRPFPSGVVATAGVAYVGSDHGTIYAIVADTGEKLWTWSTESAQYLSTPTISEGILGIVGYVSIPDNPHNSSTTEVIILDVTTDQPEEVKTITRSDTPRLSPPTVVGESIVWTAIPSSLIIHSLEDGSPATSVSLPAGTRSDPVVVNGEAYVGVEDGVVAVDIGVEGSSSGLRVAQGSTGHHDSWAETASLEIDTLDVTLEETTLEVGDETNTAVMATFANGREESVLERATLESANPDVATVDDDGTIQAVSAGETEIVVTYRDETKHIELVVEGDDSMPAPGIVGTAIGIGSGAYLQWRRE